MSEFRVSSGDLHLHLILEGGHDPSVEKYMADAKRWEELAIDSWVQLMPNPYIYMVGMYIYISKQQLLVQSQWRNSRTGAPAWHSWQFHY